MPNPKDVNKIFWFSRSYLPLVIIMQNSQPGSFMGQVQWQCQQQQGAGHWEQLNQRFQNGQIGHQTPEMDLVHKMTIEID
ncbi:hypothetical protein B9Z55_028651 [Caenorhabditis nigoni]|uniref:Uncharacterized protein n=1 Tax=Caenorhabditis nigoni TaxID=1611254 RepID=A0A2G5SB10_9PELO|nr:hypothetical protein B9Z55_028651 [Caenorhabditis nigoni]